MNKIQIHRPDKSTPYEVDYSQWCAEQGVLLREGRLEALDRENLAEEIESLGRSQRREIRSRLELLIQHLLKWQFQPGRRSESWRITVGEQRTFILGVIEDSPSLKSFPAEIFAKSYAAGRRRAVEETGMIDTIFPIEPPFSVTEALSARFWPGEPIAPHDVLRD